MTAARVAPIRVGAVAAARRVARAATAARSTGTTVRNVGRSIRLARTIARHATRATGAAMGIGIRWATRMAASAIARTTVADSRIVLVSIAAVGIAAANQAWAARVARSAVADRVVIRITTSIRDRRRLRRRIRITRCVARGISCWVIRLRLGRTRQRGAGSEPASGRQPIAESRQLKSREGIHAASAAIGARTR
jgi:hypothetical protein